MLLGPARWPIFCGRGTSGVPALKELARSPPGTSWDLTRDLLILQRGCDQFFEFFVETFGYLDNLL